MWDRDTATPPRQLAVKHEENSREVGPTKGEPHFQSPKKAKRVRQEQVLPRIMGWILKSRPEHQGLVVAMQQRTIP